MFTAKSLLKLVMGATLVVASCTVLKKEDPNKEVLAFISTFQASLASTDEEILKQFEAKQSQESILSAIRILQNKEHEFIVCTAAFQQSQVSFEDSGIKVVIPANFSSQNIEGDYHGETTLTLWLKPKNNSYVVTVLVGEDFYKTFADIRNGMEWSVEHIRETKKREPIYSKAQTIQQQFDSVIWYASYQDNLYFYVVNSGEQGFTMNYNYPEQSTGYFMGLTDENGALIIPVEYELIGTIAFEMPMAIEVRKGGKYGYFDLESRKLIIQPAYDMIIPYDKENAFAIVKQDSVYGWLDTEYEYHAGFPSEGAESWVKEFDFLPKDMRLKGDSKTFCEVPNKDYAGNGILIPPSYMVKTGLFEKVIGGISTTPVPLNGWTDYVETKGTLLQTVTDRINAVITTITERYIDGREEFYTYNRLMLVDNKQDTLEVGSVYSDGAITFRKVDDTLLEIKYEQDNPEGSEFDEYNIPVYNYYALGEDVSVTRYKSNRSFPETKYVKLDSSYLVGDFLRWGESGEEHSDFLSLATITYMRDEILAEYGYRFEDPNAAEQFKYRDWYKPEHDSIDNFKESMTEVDRYNLDFLDKIILMMKTEAV